jgi:type IX secretion system PorP/SprF family membrane protein
VRIRTAYVILLIWKTFFLGAQHFQFSQFYASPTYINPAFTGANVCGRASIIYRNQWSGIPGTFTSYQASVDHYMRAYKSGIGIQLFNDVAGVGSLRTTQISVLYAYEARINKKVMARGGLSFGSVQRRVDYSAFTFGDQIARNSPTTLDVSGDGRTTYFDVGAGGLIYTNNEWIGLAVNHLNTPDQTLLNNISPLPREYKLHGGYRLTIAEHESKLIPYINAVTFAFNYKHQSKFNQLDLGIYYNYNWFVIGAWYRGIPVTKPNKQDPNTDAAIFLIGFNLGRYKMGYSYDYTVSKLTNATSNGSHEISMAYQLCNLKKVKRRKNVLIACPKF